MYRIFGYAYTLDNLSYFLDSSRCMSNKRPLPDDTSSGTYRYTYCVNGKRQRKENSQTTQSTRLQTLLSRPDELPSTSNSVRDFTTNDVIRNPVSSQELRGLLGNSQKYSESKENDDPNHNYTMRQIYTAYSQTVLPSGSNNVSLTNADDSIKDPKTNRALPIVTELKRMLQNPTNCPDKFATNGLVTDMNLLISIEGHGILPLPVNAAVLQHVCLQIRDDFLSTQPDSITVNPSLVKIDSGRGNTMLHEVRNGIPNRVIEDLGLCFVQKDLLVSFRELVIFGPGNESYPNSTSKFPKYKNAVVTILVQLPSDYSGGQTSVLDPSGKVCSFGKSHSPADRLRSCSFEAFRNGCTHVQERVVSGFKTVLVFTLDWVAGQNNRPDMEILSSAWNSKVIELTKKMERTNCAWIMKGSDTSICTKMTAAVNSNRRPDLANHIEIFTADVTETRFGGREFSNLHPLGKQSHASSEPLKLHIYKGIILNGHALAVPQQVMLMTDFFSYLTMRNESRIGSGVEYTLSLIGNGYKVRGRAGFNHLHLNKRLTTLVQDHAALSVVLERCCDIAEKGIAMTLLKMRLHDKSKNKIEIVPALARISMIFPDDDVEEIIRGFIAASYPVNVPSIIDLGNLCSWIDNEHIGRSICHIISLRRSVSMNQTELAGVTVTAIRFVVESNVRVVIQDMIDALETLTTIQQISTVICIILDGLYLRMVNASFSRLIVLVKMLDPIVCGEADRLAIGTVMEKLLLTWQANQETFQLNLSTCVHIILDPYKHSVRNNVLGALTSEVLSRFTTNNNIQTCIPECLRNACQTHLEHLLLSSDCSTEPVFSWRQTNTRIQDPSYREVWIFLHSDLQSHTFHSPQFHNLRDARLFCNEYKDLHGASWRLTPTGRGARSYVYIEKTRDGFERSVKVHKQYKRLEEALNVWNSRPVLTESQLSQL